MREHVEEPRYVTTDDDTVYSLLSKRAARTPDDIIAEWQDDNTHQWRSATATEMLSRVREVAKGLLGLGVKAGTMVLIYSPTCYEWGVADFACAAIGAVVVPVYETDSARQTAGIVEEVDPAIAFAGDFQRAQTLEQIRVNHPGMKYVFNFKADGLDAVVDFGHGVSDETLDAAIARIKADDLLTVVYTSGSTGKPKGAMLSNRNYTHIVLNGYEILRGMLYDDNRLLLFLPLAHCFARYIQYVCIGGCGVVGYIPDAKRLLADIRSFKPTYLLGVPRVFEKVYNAASQKAGHGAKGVAFAAAVVAAQNYMKEVSAKGKAGALAKARRMAFDPVVYASLREVLGGRAQWIVAGGAPLDPELMAFFRGAGVPVYEGYGLTETTAPCAFNPLGVPYHQGSVGVAFPGFELRIAEDEEIQVKGTAVFPKYHKNEEASEDSFTEDGWYRTGDLGRIDDDGFLYIIGRKKDLIITAGGKNVSPGPIEEVIKRCEFVSQALVLGDKRPFISALVTLDEESLRPWLESKGLNRDIPMEEAANNAAVRAEVQKWVDQANEGVSRAESVRKFIILPEEFTQENGLMTASMKVIRPKVIKRYATLLNTQMYTKKK